MILRARMIIGVHGGAWGQAIKMTRGQGALEILPTKKWTSAKHFMVHTGVDYRQSVCERYDRGTEKCVVNVTDVVEQTRKLLKGV